MNAKILKVSLLGANDAGAFVGSICEPICPKNFTDNESDISLDFQVVFGMDRPNVIIRFVKSKVDFHLTWLKYKKWKRKERKIFCFLK